MSGSCFLRSAPPIRSPPQYACTEGVGHLKICPILHTPVYTVFAENNLVSIIRQGRGRGPKNGKMCVHATDESLAEINGLEFFETFSKMIENLHFLVYFVGYW